MSRSVSDATRFTATAPHAYSKPGSYRSTAQSLKSNAQSAGPSPGGGDGVPHGESAKEKVSRLRAAHAARRAAGISTWDRVIIRGRAIADTAHRVTVMGLVGLSVVAGAVTVYSFIDLSMYNRRKKAEWLEKQFANLQVELVEASKAERAGTATPEQMLLLNRERAAEQAKREKENRKGVVGTITGLFTTEGLKKEDNASSEGVLATGSRVGASIAESIPVTPVPTESASRMTPDGTGPVTAAINEHRRQGEKFLESQGAQGGSLDQFAKQATDQAKKNASGWSSWLGFGSK